MIIRRAEKSDLIECEKLIHIPELRLANGEYYDHLFLENYLDENFFLVAVIDNVISGVIMGEPIKGNGAMIWLLTVSENMRGKGVGTSLFSELEIRAKNYGIRWLVFYGYSMNEKLLDFFKKLKYSQGVHFIEYVKII
jgi:GNAT superfamily N-acetyltransferase